jgi:hypothetical protein
MRHTADVHELNEDVAAGGVHAAGREFPTFHVRIAVNAGRQEIALTVVGGLRPLGQNQSDPGSLPIVRRIEVRWGAFRRRAIARHRRHYEPIFGDDSPYRYAFPKLFHCCYADFPRGKLAFLFPAVRRFIRTIPAPHSAYANGAYLSLDLLSYFADERSQPRLDDIFA